MKKILLSSLIAVMAVSAANAKIASTDYAKSVADAAEAAAISAAATDATTKADAAKTAAINAAATDAQTKATAALGSANEYTDSEITKLTTTGAIKTNTDDIAGIKQSMESMATNETVTNLKNKLDILEGADTTDGSVRQLIKAANEAQDTTLKAYADQAEADAITTAGTNATTAISDALKDYSTTNEIATTYAPISTTYTKGEVDNLVNVKANSEDVYTKTDIDAKLGAEGTTTKAIEAAATAAATAKTIADGAVSVNTEQTTAITNLQNADTAINDKFGELNGKTVAQAIADSTYSDAEVRGLISTNTTEITNIKDSAVMKSGITSNDVTQIGTNKTAIETLNGTGDGSVSKAVTDGIAGITATVTGDAGVIKTLSQTAGKVSAARELVTTTDLDTAVNTAITNANNAAAFMSSVQGASTAEADANKAYVLTASKGEGNTMIYAWEEIDRAVLSNN